MGKQRESKGETTEGSECGFAQKWSGVVLQVVTTGGITSKPGT